MSVQPKAALSSRSMRPEDVAADRAKKFYPRDNVALTEEPQAKR